MEPNGADRAWRTRVPCVEQFDQVLGDAVRSCQGDITSLRWDTVPAVILPAVPELTGSRASEQPAQAARQAALKFEVSLGESAPLPGVPGPLRPCSSVGGHQFGQAGSGGPHAGGQRWIAIRALRLELRLPNCSRNVHVTLQQSRRKYEPRDGSRVCAGSPVTHLGLRPDKQRGRADKAALPLRRTHQSGLDGSGDLVPGRVADLESTYLRRAFNHSR